MTDPRRDDVPTDPERPEEGEPGPFVLEIEERRLIELAAAARRSADDLDDDEFGVDEFDVDPAGAGGDRADDQDDQDDEDPLGRGARAFFEWTLVVAIAIVVAVVVRTFLLAHFVVDGTSMASTLDSGDRVFVNKLSYRLHEPNRGDVIVLHQISGTSERDLIKRVIALPGETIEIRSCEVLITDAEGTTRRLIEPYLDPAVVSPGNCGGDYRPADGAVVPDDHVFVLGDNRSGSQDSRALGPVPYDDIVGRAFVVFWPRQNWQWL